MSTGYLMLDQPNPHTPQGTHPRRGSRGKLSGTCIVHTTEGAWTAGVGSLTRLVRTRSDYGCYHRACDWQDIALYYPWEWETWQDSETNNWAVGIAAACRTTDWAVMPADVRDGFYRNMGRMAADFVIYMRDTYGITVPLRRISGAEARAGVPGFCAHGDSGVSRSDPGVQFDWALFFNYTAQALGTIDTEGFLMALSDDEQREILAAAKRIMYTVDQPLDKVLTTAHIPTIADAVVNRDIPWFGFDGNQPQDGRTTTTLAITAGYTDTSTIGLHGAIAGLKELVKQLSVQQGVTIDYDAIAKAVNDDAAERLKS